MSDEPKKVDEPETNAKNDVESNQALKEADLDSVVGGLGKIWQSKVDKMNAPQIHKPSS